MKYALSVFLICILFLSGCAIIRQPNTEFKYLDSAAPPPSGQRAVKGQQGYYKLFGVIPFGNPDWGSAIRRAADKGGGGTLTNVTMYESERIFIFGTIKTLHVAGYTAGGDTRRVDTTPVTYPRTQIRERQSKTNTVAAPEIPTETEPISLPGLGYGSRPDEVIDKMGKPDRVFDFGTGERWYYDKRKIQIVIYENRLVSIVRVKS